MTVVHSYQFIVVWKVAHLRSCSSKACNEVVRGDMGIDTLRSRKDKAKLKWWYKLAFMPEDRYPKQLLVGSGIYKAS